MLNSEVAPTDGFWKCKKIKDRSWHMKHIILDLLCCKVKSPVRSPCDHLDLIEVKWWPSKVMLQSYGHGQFIFIRVLVAWSSLWHQIHCCVLLRSEVIANRTVTFGDLWRPRVSSLLTWRKSWWHIADSAFLMLDDYHNQYDSKSLPLEAG